MQLILGIVIESTWQVIRVLLFLATLSESPERETQQVENFKKGDLVRFPSQTGLPDVFPSKETKVGILVKRVDKDKEKQYYLYDRWVVLCGSKEHIVTESVLEKLNKKESSGENN